MHDTINTFYIIGFLINQIEKMHCFSLFEGFISEINNTP